MGREGVAIGRGIAGAGLTAVGIVSGNTQLAYLGASQFLQGTNTLLFGANERRREHMRLSPDASRRLPVVYGKSLVGGSLVDVRPDETDDEVIWVVVAFCHGGHPSGPHSGEVREIVEMYFEDSQRRAWRSVDADTGDEDTRWANLMGDTDDFYTVASLFDDDEPTSLYDNAIQHASVFLGGHIEPPTLTRDGEDYETGSGKMQEQFPYTWTSDHDGKGVVHAVFKLKWIKEAFEGRSIPPITALVKGNQVYDPRSGEWGYEEEDFSNSDTLNIPPGENPALQALDYLTSSKYGLDANYPERDDDGTVSEIHEQSFIDMANHCEEDITFKLIDADDVTQPRFVNRGVLDTSNDPLQNLREILVGCRGELVYQEGEFRIHIPRDKSTVSFALTEDNIVGDWSWRRGGIEDVPNKVQAEYVEDVFADNSLSTTTWPEPQDTNPYLQEDNQYKSVRNIQLPFTDDEVRAKQISFVGLKEARQDTKIEVTVRESALQLEVGDVVPLTHETPAWEEKPFWVRAIAYLPEDNLVRLTLSEFDADAYKLDEARPAIGPPGTNLPETLDVDAPSNFTVSTGSSSAVKGPGGERIPKAFISWDDPSDKKFLDYYVIQFKKSQSLVSGGSTTWTTVAQPDRGVQSHAGPVLINGRDYDFRIKAVNVAGAESEWVTVNDHTASVTGTQNPIIIADHKEIDNDNDGSADTGEATFTIFDPGGSTLDVTIKTKQGHGSFSETQNDAVFQSGNSITETVSLIEKKNSYIECEATSNESGNDQNEILTFDPDKVPEFETFFGYVKDNGEIQFFVSGDTDTESIKVEFDYNGNGTFTETQNTATNGAQHRQFSGTSNASVNRTDDAQVKATLYSEPDLAGVTKVDTIDVSRIGDQVVEVDPDEDREAGTWSMDFTLLRPGNFSVNLEEQQGDNAFSSVGTGDEANLSGIGATDSYTSDANSLVEGVTTRVRYKVTDDDSNNKVVQKNTIAFDPDKIPDHQGHTVEVDVDGNVSLELQGDSDANSWKYDYNIGTSPSVPSKSTVEGVGSEQTVDGRTATVSDFDTLSEGELIAVSVVGYSKTGGTGTTSTEKWTGFGSYRLDERGLVQVDTEEVDSDGDGSIDQGQAHFVIRAEGAGGSWALETRTRQGRGGANDWSDWSAAISNASTGDSTGSSPVTVSLIEGLLSFIGWRLKDADGGIRAADELAFDPNTVPDHRGHTLSVDENGGASLELNGDTDWEAAEYAWNIGDSPTAPTKSETTDDDGTNVDGHGDDTSGRTATISDFATLSEGQTIAVSVVGYSNTSGSPATPSGTKSTEKWSDKRTYRDTGSSGGTSKKPVAKIIYRPSESGPDSLHFDLDGELGDESSGTHDDLEARWKIDAGTSPQPNFTSWQTPDGSGFIISDLEIDTSNYTTPAMFILEVRDTSFSDNPSDRDHGTMTEFESIVAQAPGVTASTSKPDDGTTTGDGADAGGKGDGHIYAVYS